MIVLEFTGQKSLLQCRGVQSVVWLTVAGSVAEQGHLHSAHAELL